MNDIFSKMTPVFRDVLEDESLVLKPELTANDVSAWDSLAHVHLLIALEKTFGIKFNVSQIGNLKNVGELATLIQSLQPANLKD